MLLLIAAVPLQATGLVDPLLRFRQTRTPHFVIYFHAGEEQLAARLAAVVEDVRTRVGTALTVTPPDLTHVVLADQSEMANGWATPLPRNIVFLNAAVPSGVDMIGNTDDWLRLVFTHEYTHIVHLDRSGKWAWLVRGIFGRTPIAFPNLWLPQWQIEGLATFEESALTGQGRASAGDFTTIQVVGAAARRQLSLDRASGGLVRWPDGHAAYAAGLGFHEYLAQRFGPETLGTLATHTSRRLPFLGTRAFKTVYGQSLGSLWRDYTARLSADAVDVSTGPEDARRLTARGYVVAAPRIAVATCQDCVDTVIYSAQGPNDFPSLRSVGIDGTGDRRLTTRYLGSTSGISPARVLFDQQEIRRNVGLYSDLYSLDRVTGDVQAVTRDARLQDPDLAPDGVRVIAVREGGGRRELVRLALPERAAASGITATSLQVVRSEPDVQFSAPRWSPDGRFVVAERRQVGALPAVVVVDAESGAIVRSLSVDGARVVTPTWRPDGLAIVAAADYQGAPFELYEFPLDGEPVARRITHSAGAIWPDLSGDGRTIVFAGYTPEGYDLFARPYGPVGGDRLPFRRDEVSPIAPSMPEPPPLTVHDYHPLSTLLPTSWSPIVIATSDQTRLGAALAASDLLGRHAYAVDATWLVSGLDVVRPLPEGTPDWSAAYVYSRWRLSPFASASRDTLFRAAADDAAVNQFMIGEVRHELQAGVFVPISHVRRRTQLLASLVRSGSRYLFADRDRHLTLVSSRTAFGYDTARTYAYSISPEEGFAAGATVELARRGLGSRADATTTTADLRAYLPGAGRNHVIALRAAGGLSRGEDLARQAFVAGAVAASPSTIDFSADALGLVRDGLAQAAGNRLLVANAEYRLPLIDLERGLGTWPLFLRTAHASLFVDAAQVRGAPRAAGWRRAAGAELGVTAVAGYALPLDAVAGVAWGSDGRGRSGVTVFARLGRAF